MDGNGYSHTITGDDCTPCDIDPNAIYSCPPARSVAVRVTVRNSHRYSNAIAAHRCADEHPACDGNIGGERCSLHAHCLAGRVDGGSSGAETR